MKLSDHRTGRKVPLVRTRRRQPDFVRKAGAHITEVEYKPEVCSVCRGTGTHPDYPGLECWHCDGTGFDN